MEESQELINYDLYVTKQAENGAILEYSLYPQDSNIIITNLAHLVVTNCDIVYCDYKVVNNGLVELTEAEKQALIPTPLHSLEERNRADIDYIIMMGGY